MVGTIVPIAGDFRNRIPAIIGLASNVRGDPNPPYTMEDFAGNYPQFFMPLDGQDEEADPIEIDPTKPIIPLVFMEGLIELAHACVRISRFRSTWKFCMGLFIAHFVTLYLKTMIDPGESPYAIAQAGAAGGVVSSKSVDSVSVSYDFSTVANDLEGWAEWKATEYGLQFVTWAKMFSMGGMYVR